MIEEFKTRSRSHEAPSNFSGFPNAALFLFTTSQPLPNPSSTHPTPPHPNCCYVMITSYLPWRWDILSSLPARTPPHPTPIVVTWWSHPIFHGVETSYHHFQHAPHPTPPQLLLRDDHILSSIALRHLVITSSTHPTPPHPNCCCVMITSYLPLRWDILSSLPARTPPHPTPIVVAWWSHPIFHCVETSYHHFQHAPHPTPIVVAWWSHPIFHGVETSYHHFQHAPHPTPPQLLLRDDHILSSIALRHLIITSSTHPTPPHPNCCCVMITSYLPLRWDILSSLPARTPPHPNCCCVMITSYLPWRWDILSSLPARTPPHPTPIVVAWWSHPIFHCVETSYHHFQHAPHPTPPQLLLRDDHILSSIALRHLIITSSTHPTPPQLLLRDDHILSSMALRHLIITSSTHPTPPHPNCCCVMITSYLPWRWRTRKHQAPGGTASNHQSNMIQLSSCKIHMISWRVGRVTHWNLQLWDVWNKPKETLIRPAEWLNQTNWHEARRQLLDSLSSCFHRVAQMELPILGWTTDYWKHSDIILQHILHLCNVFYTQSYHHVTNSLLICLIFPCSTHQKHPMSEISLGLGSTTAYFDEMTLVQAFQEVEDLLRGRLPWQKLIDVEWWHLVGPLQQIYISTGQRFFSHLQLAGKQLWSHGGKSKPSRFWQNIVKWWDNLRKVMQPLNLTKMPLQCHIMQPIIAGNVISWVFYVILCNFQAKIWQHMRECVFHHTLKSGTTKLIRALYIKHSSLIVWNSSVLRIPCHSVFTCFHHFSGLSHLILGSTKECQGPTSRLEKAEASAFSTTKYSTTQYNRAVGKRKVSFSIFFPFSL